MTDAERDEKGISRRSALKRIGIAGAIAWSTPIISSVTTPAFAASGGGGGGCTGGCSDNICGGGSEFGTYNVSCDGVQNTAGDCFCADTPTGGCACVQFPSSFCGDYDVCGPGPGFACPDGFACVIPCCGFPFCAPAGCPSDGKRVAQTQGVRRPPTIS